MAKNSLGSHNTTIAHFSAMRTTFEGSSMLRIGSCLILASALFVGGSGCGKSGGGATPEAAYNNMVEAAKKEDMKGFMTNLTKDSQNMMVGGLVISSAMMKSTAKFTGMDTKEIDAVLTKHGVTEDAVMAKMKDAKGADDPVSVAAPLAAMVKDGPAFVSDSFAVMKKMGKGMEKSPADEFKNTTLKDVKVTGDTATGKMEKEGKTQDIHFAKEGGAWKIDIMPLVREKMKK